MLCDGLGLFKKFFTQLSSPLMLQLFLGILGKAMQSDIGIFLLFVIWGQTSKSAISVADCSVWKQENVKQHKQRRIFVRGPRVNWQN
jgi:hypothetical protein